MDALSRSVIHEAARAVLIKQAISDAFLGFGITGTVTLGTSFVCAFLILFLALIFYTFGRFGQSCRGIR